jgi:hypothetical protein
MELIKEIKNIFSQDKQQKEPDKQREVRPSHTKIMEKGLPVVTADQVHKELDNAINEILKEANISVKSSEEPDQSIIEGSSIANRFGFVNSKISRKGSEEIRKEKDLAGKEEYLRAVNYYNETYPLYSFINEDKVNEILEKYDLYMADSMFYIGDIPEKNLGEMDNFKVKQKDILLLSRDYIAASGEREWVPIHNRNSYHYSRRSDEFVSVSSDGWVDSDLHESNVKIIANKGDFDGAKFEGRKQSAQQFVVQDPIILQPVPHGYLCVTKWGEEAKEVVSPKEN